MTEQQRHTADTINDDDLDALYAERDALLAELGGREEEARERWIHKQLDETGLRAADFRTGMTMELEPAREMVAHWVGAARAMLGDAPNYTETPIEMEVKVAESPERYAFVLQRVAPGALTPHQARQRAEARIIRAIAECDVLDGDVHGKDPFVLAGRRDAVARIRAALAEER
jgi:hypothetical protein